MTRPRITDDQRRARLVTRQLLDAEHRADTVVDAADAMVVLHATTPWTVYLSAWARMHNLQRDEMSHALYDSRSLVKQLCMRRTLFVMSREILADAVSATAARVSASERTNMLRDLRRSPDFDDPDGWIDAARAAVLDDLAAGADYTAAQLRQRLPALDGYIHYKPEKSYGGRMAVAPRVLSMMGAAGEIVRGPNEGQWYQSRPRWAAMSRWLGEPLPVADAHTGHVAMIRRWLATFGPGTETDLVWWLGSTKTAVRKALADIDIVEVDLDDGTVGYVLADDADDVEQPRPQAALLPELDPTTMGYKQRDFYLGPHAGQIFDNTGNGGATAWWGGRIVGGWYQDDAANVRLHFVDDVPAAGRRALTERADALTEWLAGTQLRPGYPPPYFRQVTTGAR
ncbi:winged helix DNA-binding domain-containing protein [Gordonia sp. TBRC 11910]|uniref:Winged helix DNA-binding domain-containing protein n=1 Tax=Gordonia asplenii TaxID=2725283 RepID=A0A848KS03_9ACTN|nr:winged helix DNA-binding domain-containing protein [Gordonia asplenii]NMO00889.1 winged helix DNA-binding domain-containing protein [Gordonia asplenii]